MAFYLVTDGRTNQNGEADAFVVRASGVRQAAALAVPHAVHDATVTKLDDGREVPHAIILAALVDHEPEAAPAADEPDYTYGATDFYGAPANY
jgi:hypothetical protein